MGLLIFLGLGAAALVLSLGVPAAVVVMVVEVPLLVLLLLMLLLLVAEDPVLLFCCCACCRHLARRFLNHTCQHKQEINCTFNTQVIITI